MKKLLCAVAVLMLAAGMAAAEGELRGYDKKEGYIYVTLGQYPQRVITGDDAVDGGLPEDKSWTWASHTVSDPSAVTILTDPIVWRVLTVDEEKAYLCSDYILFATPLHRNITEYKKIGKDFSQTDLCHYLNTTFAQDAFTGDELAMLLPCENYGKIFLLDAADVKNKAIGMGNGEGMKAWATEYAIRVTGSFVYLRKAGSHSPYWVRSQSTSDPRHGRCTKQDGVLGHLVCDRENESARPAIYLDMNAFAIAGGAGTRTEPYQLVNKGE